MGQKILDHVDYCGKSGLGLRGWKAYQLNNKILHELLDIWKELTNQGFYGFRYLIKKDKKCGGFYKDQFKEEKTKSKDNYEIIQQVDIKKILQQKTKDELIGFEMVVDNINRAIIVNKEKTGVLLTLLSQDAESRRKSEKSLEKEAEKNNLSSIHFGVDRGLGIKEKYYFVFMNCEPTVKNTKNFISKYNKIKEKLAI